MKILLSHPTGNAFSREAAYKLQEESLLGEYHLALASFPGSLLDRMSRIRSFRPLRRRSLKPTLKEVVKMHPLRELARHVSSRAGLNLLVRHETGMFSVDAIYRSHDCKVASRLRKLSINEIQMLYAYEDGALHSFRQAKEIGIGCIYDLPIGYWRAARILLQEEYDLKPEWAPTLKAFLDSEEKLARKDEELKLADHIIVASKFTAKTLEYYPGPLAPIKIIPYGFPPVFGDRKYSNDYNRRLKLLFVGGLSQRKGIAELFEAVEELEKYVELTLVGRKASTECPILDQALKKHKWYPSLAHSEVLNLMRENDVLVFPSLFEGFGLVITEAMSQGMPVITTDRTAGPDLIIHGESGWLTEAGSVDHLKNCLENLISHPLEISKAGKAAVETAKQRPWQQYATEITDFVKEKGKKRVWI